MPFAYLRVCLCGWKIRCAERGTLKVPASAYKVADDATFDWRMLQPTNQIKRRWNLGFNSFRPYSHQDVFRVKPDDINVDLNFTDPKNTRMP